MTKIKVKHILYFCCLSETITFVFLWFFAGVGKQTLLDTGRDAAEKRRSASIGIYLFSRIPYATYLVVPLKFVIFSLHG